MLLTLALSACGAATTEDLAPPIPADFAGGESPSEGLDVSDHGQIPREELEQVLAIGLGAFLQHVSTEPDLREGRFVGFRLTELSAPFFDGVDLRPGDTVLSVNGMTIERPEEALRVWNGLRVASELTVEYLRDAERHQVRFAIRD